MKTRRVNVEKVRDSFFCTITMELPSLTSSGSVQSHMSVSISKKRLRLHSSHSDAWEPPLPVTTPRRNRRFSDLLGYCDGWNAAVWVWCSLSNVYLRWLLLMYMGFSLVFISVSLYAYLDDILAPNPIQGTYWPPFCVCPFHVTHQKTGLYPLLNVCLA